MTDIKFRLDCKIPGHFNIRLEMLLTQSRAHQINLKTEYKHLEISKF